MRSAFTLATVFLLLVLSPPAHAIDEGVPDRGRHSNVGLLGFDVDAGGPAPAAILCSGAVLSDRHFLTAAHCIPAVPATVEWVVTLQPGSPNAPVYEPGVFPDDFPFAVTGSVIRVGWLRCTRGLTPSGSRTDLAVVTFPEGSFAGVRPIKIAKTGRSTAYEGRAYGWSATGWIQSEAMVRRCTSPRATGRRVQRLGRPHPATGQTEVRTVLRGLWLTTIQTRHQHRRFGVLRSRWRVRRPLR